MGKPLQKFLNEDGPQFAYQEDDIESKAAEQLVEVEERGVEQAL